MKCILLTTMKLTFSTVSILLFCTMFAHSMEIETYDDICPREMGSFALDCPGENVNVLDTLYDGPDLIVPANTADIASQAHAQSRLGYSIGISNIGNQDAVGLFKLAIYLDIGSELIFIKSHNVLPRLMAGYGTSIGGRLLIPPVVGGDYNFIFHVNYDDVIENELLTNNTLAVPITIFDGLCDDGLKNGDEVNIDCGGSICDDCKPDLIVQFVAGLKSSYCPADTSHNISVNIRNQGYEVAPASTSQIALVDAAGTQVWSQEVSVTPINSGTTEAFDTTVTFPAVDVNPGLYNLVFIADLDNDVDEGQYEDNNDLIVPIEVLLCDCPDDYANGGLALSQPSLTGLLDSNADYETDGAIISNQKIGTTNSNIGVDYDAGTTITLDLGFEISASVPFDAFIDGCNGMGGNQLLEDEALPSSRN